MLPSSRTTKQPQPRTARPRADTTIDQTKAKHKRLSRNIVLRKPPTINSAFRHIIYVCVKGLDFFLFSFQQVPSSGRSTPYLCADHGNSLALRGVHLSGHDRRPFVSKEKHRGRRNVSGRHAEREREGVKERQRKGERGRGRGGGRGIYGPKKRSRRFSERKKTAVTAVAWNEYCCIAGRGPGSQTRRTVHAVGRVFDKDRQSSCPAADR